MLATWNTHVMGALFWRRPGACSVSRMHAVNQELSSRACNRYYNPEF